MKCCEYGPRILNKAKHTILLSVILLNACSPEWHSAAYYCAHCHSSAFSYAECHIDERCSAKGHSPVGQLCPVLC
jgi:hypothetical protein